MTGSRYSAFWSQPPATAFMYSRAGGAAGLTLAGSGFLRAALSRGQERDTNGESPVLWQG